jgi:hypothetical protein
MIRSTIAVVFASFVAASPILLAPILFADDQPPQRPDNLEEGCLDGRALYYIERHGINGTIDADALLEATRAYIAERDRDRALGRIAADGVGGSVWTSIGPNNGGGRMTSIAPHPTTAGTLIVGAAGGGAWKTTDSGATWNVLTDAIGNLAVGAVAYAPSDPTKIYLGTGENAYSGDVITGIGLLYSPDGGTNWTLPSSVIAQQFFRISINPTVPNEIVAATTAGLLRSTTGQNGFGSSLIAHDSSGMTKAYGDINDLVRDPSNAQIMYATTSDRGYWCDRYTCGNPYNYYSPRVMKSTDGGQTWNEFSTGLPTSTSTTLVTRMGIAIAPSNTATLYAAFATYDANTGVSTAHVYKSTNSAASWSELTAVSGNASTGIKYYLSNQAYYDNAIAVSPSDANIVVAGGVQYIKTIDGGTTWTNIPTSGSMHVDCHDIRYDTGGTLFFANDGGFYSSSDNGSSVTSRNTNLVTRQFYTLAMDSANRNRMFGGLQDNGTLRRPDAGGTSWDVAYGGDGFDCQINADAPGQVLMSWQTGNIIRTQNGGANASSIFTTYRNPIWPSGEVLPFATKVVADPNTPSTVYTATYRLWKSAAFGDGWTPLPIATTDMSTWSTAQGISSMAIAPGNSQIIMVAKYDQLFRSTNGGTSWTRVISGLPSFRNINSIAIDPTNSSTAYVALAGTTSPSVYYTTNGGTAWTSRSTGLPAFSAQVVRFDPTDATTLYCGTDIGVYRSTNSGANWSVYGTGIPAVSVYDVQILKDGTKLRAATHGRGVWELTVTSPANNAPSVSASSTPAAVSGVVTIAAGASVNFSGTFSDADGDPMTAKWVFPDDGSSTATTSGGNVSHTFPRAGRYPVTLKVTDTHSGAGTASFDVLVTDAADACSTPVVIPATGPFPYTVAASTESSTAQGSDPVTAGCFPYTDQSSLWYSFTPPSTAAYVISLCGSQASATLIGYTASSCPVAGNAVGALCLTRYGGNHDSSNVDCASAASRVTATLTGGTTYLFELTNYFFNDFGPLYLTIAPSGTGINESTLEAGPAIGAAAGAQSVSISGYNFQSGATVSFGGSAASNVIVVSSNIITCTTPAHAAGTVDLAVTSGGTTSTLEGGYTYIANAPLAPTNVVAAATASTTVHVSWTASAGADSYQVYRGVSLAGTVNTTAGGTITFDDSGASASTAYLYKVRALTGGSSSGDSSADLATTVIFTDDPLVVNTTPVKATHLTQLRTAVNAVRTLAGLGAATITDNLPAGVNVKAVHITELRTALDLARSTLGLSALSYTHSLVQQSTKVYAADFTELRNGVK